MISKSYHFISFLSSPPQAKKSRRTNTVQQLLFVYLFMLVNTYAHIQQSSRVELGRKFEEGFYAKQESPSPQAVPAEGEPTISMTALLELLKNADPEVKAQLRLALLT